MLKIHIDAREVFNEETSEFITVESRDLTFEHSLASIARWESMTKRPFFDEMRGIRTNDDMVDYIQCMCLDEIDRQTILVLSPENLKKIQDYINDPMTATTFSDRENRRGAGGRQIITAEIIYYWMVSMQIPLECEHWHINRLLTLIRVCGIKNSPKKKMSKKDLAAQNRMLNRQRQGLA